MENLSFGRIVEFIDLQARMKMKAQSNKLFLSYLWWILEPLLYVSLFYFVFGLIMKRGGGEGFVMFLIVGKVVFMWFSKGVVMGSTSLRQNRGIITLRSIPKWIFPIVSVQIATYKSVVALAVVLVVMLLAGYVEPDNWWQLIPLLMITYILVSAVACFLSMLVAVAEDFSQIISLLMIGLLFSSGIFWDINTISDEQLRNLVMTINPLAGLIDSYRTVILQNQLIELVRIYPAIGTGVTLWIMNILALNHFNNKITRLVIS
ncbi:MAG: ABC transporter permease [Candidatus Sedimenticola sp. PURPLELP]